MSSQVKPICTCGANKAEYRLINGAETTYHCSPCMEETLLDMACCNNTLNIQNNGVDENNLTEFKLV